MGNLCSNRGKKRVYIDDDNVDDDNVDKQDIITRKTKEDINQQNNNNDIESAPKEARTGVFNPKLIISKGVASKPASLPTVEQLGEITIDELHKYECNNPDRRLLSLFGTVFDVTTAITKYGPDGICKEFAGHDITLCLGSGKMEQKWLDKFVLMNDKHIESANGWVEFYETQYPKAGTLKKWQEDQSKWRKLTEQEIEELNTECIIM